ncbi:MAG: NADPH-dependent FMN reductase [Myxococcaceae bacterium]
MRILGISGSLRAESSNARLLRAAAGLVPPGVALVTFQGLGDLPHFNPDLDGDLPPEPVRAFRALLGSVDGLLISSPEYAHGVPGTLKNALDWVVSSGELVGLPVLLVTASPGGGALAHAALVETLAVMTADVLGASFATPLARAHVRPDGALTEPGLEAQLRAALEALVEAAGRHARARP